MQEKLTADQIFDRMVPRILEEQPDIARRVNAVLGIELIGDNGGYWTLDLTANPHIERGKTAEPRCILSAHTRDFEELIENGSVRGALDAFKKKRIRASGHLPTVLKLEGLLMSLVRNNSRL